MYVDPITRQTYDYATSIPSDNNPRNIIEPNPDADGQDFYIRRPEPTKRKPPLMFTPNQIKTTIRPNTFTAQDTAGIYSNAELFQFWNRILFSKHLIQHSKYLEKLLVIHSFLPILQTTLMHTFLKQIHLIWTTLRIGLHDKFLNLTPLFTPSLFADAFITLFGYPRYILTQCGIYFSTIFLYEHSSSKFTKQFLSSII